MEWDGSVVVVVGDERTRRRIDAALSAREVRHRDPGGWPERDEATRPGVAVVEAAVAPSCDDPGNSCRDAPDDAVVVLTRGTAVDRCRTLSRPVDPSAVREAVDRAARRAAYAAGLDALSAAATEPPRSDADATASPWSPSGLAPVAARLDEVLAEFDHEDFVAAFRVAAGEAR